MGFVEKNLSLVYLHINNFVKWRDRQIVKNNVVRDIETKRKVTVGEWWLLWGGRGVLRTPGQKNNNAYSCQVKIRMGVPAAGTQKGTAVASWPLVCQNVYILIGFRFLFLLMYFECVTCASCIWQKIICNILVKGKSKPESTITKRNRERIII